MGWEGPRAIPLTEANLPKNTGSALWALMMPSSLFVLPSLYQAVTEQALFAMERNEYQWTGKISLSFQKSICSPKHSQSTFPLKDHLLYVFLSLRLTMSLHQAPYAPERNPSFHHGQGIQLTSQH